MKRQETYSKKQFGSDRSAACRSLSFFACITSIILCLGSAPAISGEPAASEPNAPSIAGPNDPNTLAQSTAAEPNRPPKPGIDDAAVLTPSARHSKPESARRDWLIAGLPESDLARKIWRERITVPQDDEAGDRKIQLQQLIDRIRSIEFKPQEPPQEPIIVLEQTPAEPNTVSLEPADRNLPETHPTQAFSFKSRKPTVSDDTLNILVEQLKEPELLMNPFELGEILFNAGRLEEAAVCYREALARIDPNQPDPIQKRPWIIFQIGNCLRKIDPTEAIEAYSQLITQHVGSFWTEPAKAQAGLITWRKEDKPRLLIEQSRPKPVRTKLPIGLIKDDEPKSLTEPNKGEQTQNK